MNMTFDWTNLILFIFLLAKTAGLTKRDSKMKNITARGKLIGAGLAAQVTGTYGSKKSQSQACELM